MASKISLETEAIKKSTSDKVGKIYSGVIGFFASYAMALFIGWRFTLLLMVCLPFMMILGAMLGVFFGGHVHKEMNAYA
jgi:ABC-type multidrug transport system fused ATPase/permease subunit